MPEETKSTWLNTYSMPVVPRMESLVMLSGLAAKYKREAWAEISRTNPALAQLLKDPLLKQAMAHFDIFVDSSIVPTMPTEPVKGRKLKREI